MCTVSWIHKDDGYELFCNRDELLTRKAAFSPQISEVGGVRIVAPRDGDFGGSWISVNEFGLSLSLLNLYESATPGVGEFTSRGLLLIDQSESCSQEKIIERLSGRQLNQFQPFTLLVMEPGKDGLIVKWDGSRRLIERGDKHMPLTSSSFDSARVIQSRKENFRRLANSSEAVDPHFLWAFHSSHEPAASAYSTCMHREDAETVSFSHIKVESDSIEFRYYPHPPCRQGTIEINAETKILMRRKR